MKYLQTFRVEFLLCVQFSYLPISVNSTIFPRYIAPYSGFLQVVYPVYSWTFKRVVEGMKNYSFEKVGEKRKCHCFLRQEIFLQVCAFTTFTVTLYIIYTWLLLRVIHPVHSWTFEKSSWGNEKCNYFKKRKKENYLAFTTVPSILNFFFY